MSLTWHPWRPWSAEQEAEVLKATEIFEQVTG